VKARRSSGSSAVRRPRPAWDKPIPLGSLRESSASLDRKIILTSAAARSAAARASRSPRAAWPAALASAPPCPPSPRATRTGLAPASSRVAIGAPLVRATMATHAPWPSHQITLIRSPRRPRKTKRWPENGSCFSVASACAASVANPRRMSVTPAASQTLAFAGTGITTSGRGSAAPGHRDHRRR
jgi:hypothetical protein